MRSFKMDNSTKRLFEVVIDDLDEVLSQAVDKHEREEAFSKDGLDEILSQSLLKLINYSCSSYPTRASYSGQVDGFRNPMKTELKTRPYLKAVFQFI